MAGDVNRPNGLAFSPDESKLYVVEAGATPPRSIRAFDVVDGGTRLANKPHADRRRARARPDGLRVDVDGNLWVRLGHGRAKGSTAWRSSTRTGKLIGRIDLPERCANLCFGGPHRNRLFMAASTSLYSLYVNTQGAGG